MLKKLAFRDVGPGDSLALPDLAPRFNLITGDNGLGKSFILEAAWWVLTRTWHESPLVPSSPTAEITARFDGAQKPVNLKAPWDVARQEWNRGPGRPSNPGLVLFARIDGSFSAWDPARNYRLYTRADGGKAESPAAYQFPSSTAVLDGLERDVVVAGKPTKERLCAGLIDDWTRWQAAKTPEFGLLTRLLQHLGPDDEPLLPGEPFRVSLDDDRRIPTIRMPYGKDVPITFCPAGVRRMCQLAYLLAWSLSKHKDESLRVGQPLSRQVIVLLDEPETHLHPRWQRTVLPSIAKAIEGWDTEHAPQVQFLVATHSPLVLVSMEPIFDAERDALWKLDLVGTQVRVEKDEWHKRGDVERWLKSDVFDMRSTTFPAAEQAMKEAGELMMAKAPDVSRVRSIDVQLQELLPQMDVFFLRWRHYMEKHLVPEREQAGGS